MDMSVLLQMGRSVCCCCMWTVAVRHLSCGPSSCTQPSTPAPVLPVPHPPCPPAPTTHILAQVVPGEVTILTGVPNSGKSEWLDALAVNLAESCGWRFAMCSMEKKPRDHARQLLEKRARKPLLEADYARGLPQMSPAVSERQQGPLGGGAR